MSSAPPIVLVHGAFQTAATWDLVAARLEGRGRRVMVAGLTGLESEGAALTEAVDLDTHIRDVVSMLEAADLRDVVLVGHSYGGMVITGAADCLPSRLSHLVYVDGLVPDAGQSAMDLFPERTRRTFQALAAEGGGWRIRPNEQLLHLWGLEEGPARTFVEACLSDFTIRCFEQPLNAPRAAAAAIPRTYIASVRASYPGRVVFAPFAERARREGWSYHELPTGHDSQVEMPDALASLIDALPAAESSR